MNVDTFEILDSLVEVLHHLSIGLERDKLVSPLQAAIDEIRKELPKALRSGRVSKRVKPLGDFRGDARRCPPVVVAVRDVIDELVTVGYQQSTVRWALYQAIEAGELAAGIQTQARYVPPSKVKRRQRKKDPENPEQTIPNLIHYSPEEYAGQTGTEYREVFVWIWPTPRMIKKYPSLKKGYVLGNQVKMLGRRVSTDLKLDADIEAAWRTGSYNGYADLARCRDKGETAKQMQAAVERHRKRMKRMKEGSDRAAE